MAARNAKSEQRSAKSGAAARSNSKTRSASTRSRGRESRAAKLARCGRILKALHQEYPDATCALQHASALHLLVATILSAQCTDVRVNMVTPGLFARYPDAAAFAGAEQAELEGMIRSTGFYRNKAKNLIGMGRRLCEAYGGAVPAGMTDLLTLPGVARKTANCVLGTWFRKNEGIVVDTHVGRLALRLGLLQSARDDKDAVKIEQDLMKLVPRDDWTWLSHALIEHGRRVCVARKPRCERCALANDCPSAFVAAASVVPQK